MMRLYGFLQSRFERRNGEMRLCTRRAPRLLYLMDRMQLLSTLLCTLGFWSTEGIGYRRWEQLVGRHPAVQLLQNIEEYTMLFGVLSILLGIAIAIVFKRGERNLLFVLISIIWCILQPSYGSA
jgi:hypothetical protein